jgi:hypothetical protein
MPLTEIQLLSNCVLVATYRESADSPGAIFITEARDHWVPQFDTPYPTSSMSDAELRAVKATPAGDHAVSLSWTNGGVAKAETFADEGVPAT